MESSTKNTQPAWLAERWLDSTWKKSLQAHDQHPWWSFIHEKSLLPEKLAMLNKGEHRFGPLLEWSHQKGSTGRWSIPDHHSFALQQDNSGYTTNISRIINKKIEI